MFAVCRCVDLSVVIKLDIGQDNTALSYAHTFSLQSPTFPAPHSDMCLALEYTSLAQFTVKLACLSAERVDVDVLRENNRSLGFDLHRVNLNVGGKDASYEKCLLVFDISAKKSGVLAAISSISMTEGTCAHPGLFCFLFTTCVFFEMFKHTCSLCLNI